MALLDHVRTACEALAVSRGTVVLLLLVTGLTAVFEGVGLGMLLPVFAYIESGAEVDAASLGAPVRYVGAFLEALNIPVGFGVLVALAGITMVLRQVFFFLKQYMVAHVTQDAGKALRRLASRLALEADLRFFIERGHGNFLHAIVIEPINAATLVTTAANLLMNGIQVLVYLLIMAFLSWQLMLIATPIIVVGWLVLRHFVRSAGQSAFAAKEALGVVNESVSEFVRGIRLIKLRAHERSAAATAGSQIDAAGDLTKKYDITRAYSNSLAPIIVLIGSFLLLHIAADSLQMTLAELGIFMLVIMRAQQTATQINTDRLIMARQLVSFDHVEQFVMAARAGRTIDGGDRPFTFARQIEFKGIEFAYPGERSHAVLRGVDLSVPFGQTIALTGPSGAGKSTLVDLLSRYFDQSAGEILVDGLSHRDFDLVSLRRNVAMVPQDTFLFRSSVRDNLTFGLDPVPCDAAIETALVQAHALDFVKALPNGLDTRLGEGGADLSGGQRQRLALARALVQQPTILVLDEPTSALDTETEAVIRQTLTDFKGKLTIIIIAHRLTTIRGADRIFVLQQGRIEDAGGHDELLVRSPLYRKLFDAQ